MRMEDDPIEFFQHREKDLFKAIQEGMTNYLGEENKSTACCLYFFPNRKKPTQQIDEIKLMIEVGLGIDVLRKADDLFSIKAPYLPSVVEALSTVAEDYSISFNPALSTINTKNLFIKLSRFYSKSKGIPIEDETYNKLAILLEHYKIFFSIDPLDSTSIISLPLKEKLNSPLPIVTIVSVINFIFKNKSLVTWYDSNTRRITISCTKRVALTTLQIKLVNKSKKLMQDFLTIKGITVLEPDSKECSYSDPVPTEQTQLNEAPERILSCKTFHEFKIIESFMNENFGHHYFQIKYKKKHEEICYFILTNVTINKHDANQPGFIDFLSTVNILIEENPIKFTGLDTISAIIGDYNEGIGLIFSPANHKLLTPHTLTVPMRSETDMILCENKVNYALQSYSFDLEVKENSWLLRD